jgi:hypothetical protein
MENQNKKDKSTQAHSVKLSRWLGGKLFLGDLKERKEEEIKEHIAREYADENVREYGKANPELLNVLADYDIVIAYESVGDYGCDSSSFFVIHNKKTGQLFENHGSHCSCYGFEGQWKPEETSVEYLKSDKFNFHTGGYDNEEDENKRMVKDFVNNLSA